MASGGTTGYQQRRRTSPSPLRLGLVGGKERAREVQRNNLAQVTVLVGVPADNHQAGLGSERDIQLRAPSQRLGDLRKKTPGRFI